MTEDTASISLRCEHFVEPDGSVVCICMECLRTLARSGDESDLHIRVPEHVCPGDWKTTERGTETHPGNSAARSCAQG